MSVIDLFGSRLSNQIEKYFAWKTDPHSFATDVMQQECNPGSSICISHVFLNSESTLQKSEGEIQYSNIDNSNMTNSTLVSNYFCNVISQLFLLQMSTGVLGNTTAW